MAIKKPSRLESNKEARRVLNRHGVNLSYCQYSFSGREVRLTGTLVRFDGTDFKASEIEHMIYDFQKYLDGFVIVGDLDNWSFSSEHIRYHGEKKDVEAEVQSDEDSGEYY